MTQTQITLATLKDATKQQVFDQVAKHLLTQNVRSENPDYCAYRGDNGLMCAAGCLISDSEYKPEMDHNENGSTWHDLIESGLVPNAHPVLIKHLQHIHDNEEPKSWRECLVKAAKNFELVMPEV